ncbi:NUDIX hydrolase [Micromonospora sp. DT44]|uniref:NUDIX hydrolase n=1 Tax=Micromonospora sp. DT44 TaxID=3393439 RepID=UPI003CE7D5C8
MDDYYVCVRPDIAVVIALQDGRLPLVRQYKHGVREITLELPAGMIKNDETPEDAGRRELREETGWLAPTLTCIGSFHDDSTRNTNRVYCLLSPDAYPAGAQQLDAHEAAGGLEVVEVALDDLVNLLASGTVRTQSSVAAAYRALAWLAHPTTEGDRPIAHRRSPS